MPVEVEKLKQHVTEQQEHKHGGVFTYTTGKLAGKSVVFAPANVGMVFAGSVATTMIEVYKVEAMLFTGVAGGLKPGQAVGDLVLGADVVNYEFDCRAFVLPFDPDYRYQLGELPFLKWRFYEADEKMLALAKAASVPDGVSVVTGRIASGSTFVTTEQKKAWSQSVWEPLGFPDAVEMENAGVAQICKAYALPYLSLRALSDLIDGDANDDFNAFCAKAADNVFPIVEHVVKNL
uniref:adenosylhomocysteine nucleosidase n=1 Tax=Prymnesium polylepis TaxID=72548 RepID=A0A7S4I429_9EUKA